MIKSTSLSGKIFDGLNILFLLFMALITLYPFWHVLVGSIMPYEESIKSSLHFFPGKVSFEAYEYVFSKDTIVKSLLVSLFVTAAGTLYQLLITAITAYPLIKQDLPGRSAIFLFIIFTMFFGGGLIPYYLLIKSLGMVNSLAVMIIPAAISTYNMIVLKTFFQNIPIELEESAKMDGAGYMRIFFQIILPLSVPSLVTIGLFIAVGQWNNWYVPMLFLNDKDLWPLAIVLRDILINNNMELTRGGSFVSKEFMLGDTIKNAVVMVSVVPIIIVYPFIQKHFVKGVMIGSIKS
ncbi:putative ABC transporter permease protein YtcP [Paenibacillus baekrokdamisoli]|uniref:Putative ABC transporter permease protein YtcP n=1 Tax=Paenibacillus baekrokdamisoli TaxID=1712516 RepID=A0A3G9J990_9BACL|nr:carbohydrate ABC transporter permease [Paenibacillus baekrokdamisoli]MBB3072547.1 putative aldouronate transport system permease protein [Paenibacillus baekrokdamisoli]BBH22401.1 putative ABC transporter permease protein YtcP [Paenibacillus baekrokdamisoli]